MERMRTTGVLFLLLTFIMVIFSGCKAQTEIEECRQPFATEIDTPRPSRGL